MIKNQRGWLWLAVLGLCLAMGTGCGGEKDKGINSGLDRPVPPTNKG